MLAARRGPGMRNPGDWEFPGGKVEPGESDEFALTRELREELALDVSVGSLVARAQHGRIELIAYLCTTDSTPHPTEHDRIGWFTATELHQLQMSPPNREVSDVYLSSFPRPDSSIPPAS